jgi:hypothetical protein
MKKKQTAKGEQVQRDKSRSEFINEEPENLMERQNPSGRDISTIDRQEGTMQHGSKGGNFANSNETNADKNNAAED